MKEDCGDFKKGTEHKVRSDKGSLYVRVSSSAEKIELWCTCPDKWELVPASALTPSTFIPHAPKIEKVYCYCSSCVSFWKEWSDNKK